MADGAYASPFQVHFLVQLTGAVYHFVHILLKELILRDISSVANLPFFLHLENQGNMHNVTSQHNWDHFREPYYLRVSTERANACWRA